MDDNGMECESDVEKPDGASSSHGTPYCENQNHFLDFFGGRLSFSDAGFTCSKRCETT